ncbi:threonine aldolase family protein [Frigidibacter sp. ROC022]|uniref:threonine aldolase family protein n=1 Tax=Frigidibacter sp. ROC022 TaxID=2971796 RepID=UPI00215B69FA|nr:low specificity L-threonine aldolase [Frigidibacter sp. ROC022]MCR8722940.1 low specificity L-threonine aldolase [Frigidibacter sp. ROC022]
MFFASDNTSGVHPRILDALVRANDGYPPSYGDDAIMARVRDRLRETFEAPEAAVYLVATGTAANSLILGTLAQPYETIFCTPMSHINEDEANAPEFYTGGAKLTLTGTEDAKMSAATLRKAIEAEGTRGVHGPKRGPVSLTNVTERGTVYDLDELGRIGTVAKEFGLPLHLDGARFGNAVEALGCTAAEMSWKAGVDAVSFGGTKSGCMGVEAVVFFDPARAEEFEFRRKRGGHLFSKHRYLSAQMAAYLEDDLWRSLAAQANAACQRLAQALKQMPDVRFSHDTPANIIFASWPRGLHEKLKAAGAHYHLYSGSETGPEDEMQEARLVTSWSTSEEDVDRFLEVMRH